ncbi:MAG TPA: tetratricopeptide repeat protein [Burkholderiales bacterium]|nr:tetratricopeptide repeat protein [Burkholderiales bacterium]
MSPDLRALLPVAVLSLAACAQNPATHPIGFPPHSLTASANDLPISRVAQQSDEEESLEERARRIFATQPPPATNLPDTALNQELLFKFLLSEIAAQRGNPQLAAQGFLELAKSTHDPRVARRATELASYARLQNSALEAARLWYDLDKSNPQARQTLVGLLLSGNKLQEAKPHLKAIIAADGNTGQGLLQLHSLLSKHPDKAAVYAVVKELAQDYKQMPEAHFALAQAAFAAGKTDVALAESAQAMRLRPDWELGALLQAQLLQQSDSAQKAADYLKDFLQAHPNANEARANYARFLINNKQLKEARDQYVRMQEADPINPDIAVTTGLLSLQLNDFQAAEAQLKRGLELNYRDPDTLRFYIGQIYEERKQPDEAMKWYAQVNGGEQLISARARYAFLLGRQNKLAEARTYLHNVEVSSDAQRTMLIQAEAQLLREAKAYRDSYDLLAGALEKQPDNTDLLYDAALAAEKLDKLDVVESNLRKVIKLKPDHAQAYNALGYTLGDRTDRYAEAKQYVEKALELSPDDPFILDSVGWVYYKMGNQKEALDYLERAFKRRPDPEIAAHLGEVMWAKGMRADAETIWRGALKEHPDNELLQDTVKRFLP